MPSLSLQDISRHDVDRGIAEVVRDGVPKGRGSTKFCLVVARSHLPPKYLVALAARRSHGRELSPNEFTGGAQTNVLLTALGFSVVACGCGGAKSNVTPKEREREKRPKRERERNQIKGHFESQPHGGQRLIG